VEEAGVEEALVEEALVEEATVAEELVLTHPLVHVDPNLLLRMSFIHAP
jgi:hypothetical protein